MNKLRITEQTKPSITPVRGVVNKFKIKKNTSKTTIILVR